MDGKTNNLDRAMYKLAICSQLEQVDLVAYITNAFNLSSRDEALVTGAIYMNRSYIAFFRWSISHGSVEVLTRDVEYELLRFCNTIEAFDNSLSFQKALHELLAELVDHRLSKLDQEELCNENGTPLSVSLKEV